MISPLMLSVSQGSVGKFFDDTCDIYNRTDVLPASVPGKASDGMGGFVPAASDGQGGSNITYDDGILSVPCTMDELTGGGASQKGDVAVQKTRQTLYVPSDTQVSRFDKVITAAGNNGINRQFHILDIYRSTDQLDLGLLIEETTN